MREWELHLGDALQVLPTLDAGSVDCVIADPPYGITRCRWDSPIPLGPMWEHLARVARPNAAFVFTAGQPFASALVMSKPEWFRHEWVWVKNCGSNYANTVREPMKEHEHVLVFSRGGWAYNPQPQRRSAAGLSRRCYVYRTPKDSECYNPGLAESGSRSEDRVPSSCQRFNREVGLHPTQKPVALLEYLVRTYTAEGDTVLDFCAGSGTTGVACVKTGRRFIGIEKDPRYHVAALERLAAVDGPLFAAPAGEAAP